MGEATEHIHGSGSLPHTSPTPLELQRGGTPRQLPLHFQFRPATQRRERPHETNDDAPLHEELHISPETRKH